MFFNNLKIFLSLKSYFLLLWAFEKKLGSLLKRKWLFLDLFWVCFVVTVFGLWCPLLIHWIHLQCVDEKFHQQPSLGHTANLPLCHQSRTRTLALCFKPGKGSFGVFILNVFIIHTASKLCVSHVALATTQYPGSQPKVTSVTPAHHTCQHLIKSTQNAFANLRSLWHSEVSLTF